jgi:uncharacterized FAD-dependent dehydrogenase
MDFQRHWESAAFVAGGGDYSAPAQIGDFLAGRPSTRRDGRTVLPAGRALDRPVRLRAVLRHRSPARGDSAFDRQIKGFAMADAVLTGVETRTSSPIRIKRGADFQSINTRGLYPAGEGAGYAGGILSAGVDGIKVAEAVALSMLQRQPRLRRAASPAGRQFALMARQAFEIGNAQTASLDLNQFQRAQFMQDAREMLLRQVQP